MALKDLYNGYYKAVHDARAILDRADRERRDLTADESAQYDRCLLYTSDAADE